MHAYQRSTSLALIAFCAFFLASANALVSLHSPEPVKHAACYAAIAFAALSSLFAIAAICIQADYLPRIVRDYQFYASAFCSRDCTCPACSHVTRSVIIRESLAFAIRAAYKRTAKRAHRYAFAVCLTIAACLFVISIITGTISPPQP